MTAALASSAIFIIILMLVVLGNPGIDDAISQKVALLGGGAASSFFIFLSSQLDKILVGISVLAILLLYFKDRKKEAFILSISLVAGYLLSNILKFAIQRPRPLLSAVQETGYSFPSNHSVVAVILFLSMIYIFAREIKNNLAKNAFIFANVLLILLVGFSRIYLNVHWFTDVIGGFAFGVVIVSLVTTYLK